MCFGHKPIIWHRLNVDLIHKSMLFISKILRPCLSGYPLFSSAFGLAVSQVVLWLLMPKRFSFCSFLKFLNGQSIPGQSFLPLAFHLSTSCVWGTRLLAWGRIVHTLSKYKSFTQNMQSVPCYQQFYFIKAMKPVACWWKLLHLLHSTFGMTEQL